ncbi:hypothetical protein [Streptomyces sp. ISL-11]|uniref:hypothetical protein n=1 Tax=Streptomyces sp. ISL-11 TaxID=2819174 RepID=UPI001BE5E9A3|nr:hypothetical protein [Streptomyces sp. ISL-11]MBT2384509.1 hypothetical protein [Streptomyces sp. ISL-11]
MTSRPPAAGRNAPEPHRALAHWLAARVRTQDRHTLGQLLRNDPRTQGWQHATAFATDPGHRQAYGATAWLFALYHQSIPTLDERFLYGSGDVGRALRRLGPPHNSGPKNTGCYRLYERLVTYGPLPLTALDQAVCWMRSQGRIPPPSPSSPTTSPSGPIPSAGSSTPGPTASSSPRPPADPTSERDP